MKRNFLKTAFFAAFLIFATFPAMAQTRGTISGYVRDPSDAVLPNATVKLTNEQTGATRETKSNDEGFYQFLALPSGTYTLEADLASFRRYVGSGIILRVDENVRADVRMEVGAVTEQVQVQANAAVIDTRSSTLASVVDDRRIVDLPLRNRNVMQLAGLLPGVTQVAAGTYSDSTESRSGPRITVNGGRQNQTYETLNNTYFNHPSRNTGLNPPPPDAVQEFRIQTANYTAENGRNAGAIVNLVSKAGTNEFHGSAWEFYRDSDFNARSFFDRTIPPEQQNQYGAAAGGPIRSDKVFVFGSYEGIGDRRAASTTDTYPPTAAEIVGDFSHLSRELRNPYDGAPLPGNRIPASLMDPAATNLLQYIPAAPPDGRLTIATPAPRDAHFVMARGDWNINSRQSAFIHYAMQQTDRDNRSLFPNWIGAVASMRVQNAGINHTFVIRPTLLNQFTIGFTRAVHGSQPNRTITNQELLLAGMPDYIDGGATRFSVSGRFSLTAPPYEKFLSTNYDINDGFTWIKGRHTMKFGFQYLDLAFFQAWLGPPNFSFNGTRTGDPVADFLTGAYRDIAINFGVRVNDGLSYYSAAYAQDDFKVTPRLTLNFGLRYEVSGPWVDKGDRLNTLDLRPGVQSKVVPNAPPNMLFVGDLPRGLYPTDRNNFGPRLGFAYDVSGNGRFAIRGAWGLFYDTVNADSIALENPPFAGSTRFFTGRLSTPLAGQTAPPVVPDAENFEFVYPINLFFHDLGIRTPYIQTWNLTLERQFGKDWSVQAAYVGKDSKKLQAYRPFNVAQWRPGATLENIPERAPFLPGIYGTEIIVLSSAFNQHYESAQFRVDKRFSRNFTVLGSYTLGKAIDHNSEYSLGACVSNPYDLDSDRGRADYDSRHTVAASWLWTPVTSGKGWFRRVLGGWNLSGTHRIRSGYPMTFYIGDDVALGGDICGGGEQHPNLLRNPARSHNSQDDMIAKFFDTEAFEVPREGTYGSAGRNILSGPGSSITDLAVLKDFGVTERARIQVRAEFANAFNQVNFGTPRRTMTDGLFGQITTAGAGRQIQLGLKVIW